MNNFAKAILGALVAFAFASPAQAWYHGAPSGVGKAAINLGGADLTSQLFINLPNASGPAFNSGATPAALDAQMFPVRNFSGNIQFNWTTLSTPGPWTATWDAGRSFFRIVCSVPATLSNATNATFSNGAGSGSPTITGGGGTAGSITINWTSTSSGNCQWDGSYTGWASNTTGRFAIVRSGNVGWNGQSDLVAYNNGIYVTKEFVDFTKALKPEAIRPMGWNILRSSDGHGTNVVSWNYRRTTNSLYFNSVNGDFPPGIRCGGGAAFCTISVSGASLTAAAADDTPLGGWVDGEQIAGNVATTVPILRFSTIGNNGGKCQFTTTDTSNLSASAPVATMGLPQSSGCGSQGTTIVSVDSPTQFTTNVTFSGPTCSTAGTAFNNCGLLAYQTLSVTGKSGGAVVMLGNDAFPTAVTAGNSTFTYNAVLNKALYIDGGLKNSVPLEVQIQIANLVNANLWYNFPNMARDAFMTSASNLIYANLNGNLRGIFEWCNELFNFTQHCAQYSVQMGTALGITSFASPDARPFQALKNRLVNGNILPATNWSGAFPRLDRTYCFQAFTSGAAFATDAMQGNALVSPGSAAYQAYVSPYISNPGVTGYGFNTTVAAGGNGRPIDVLGGSDGSICYAPYSGGGTAFSGQSDDSLSAPTSFDVPLLTNVFNFWNGVGGTQADAKSLIDQAVRGDALNRVQTVTASGTLFTTPAAHNFSVNDEVRFTVAGGTSYSGLTLSSPYKILSTSSAGCPGAVVCNFTAGQLLSGAFGSAVNAGTAGSGTTSVGYLCNAFLGASPCNLSIFALPEGVFTKYQNMVTTGFSPTPTGGTPKVRQYEGALEPTPPTVAQCGALTPAINSTDCATISAAFTAWKNDPLASATTQYYFQLFAAQANSSAPAWLTLNGVNIWGLNSNTSFVAPAPFQTYYGFCSFSSGVACHHIDEDDLRPANDNDTIWQKQAM